MITKWKCPKCGNANPNEILICQRCNTRLDGWVCPSCGWMNSGKIVKCSKCNANHPYALTPQTIVCTKCGLTLPINTNHCPKCRQPVRPLRLNDDDPTARITTSSSTIGFLVNNNDTLVVAKPDISSERLYITGPGDILPYVGESGDFYQVRLPGSEDGYVSKKYGCIVEVGLEEVQEPLGYARINNMLNITSISRVDVVAFQPNGESEILYSLKKEDRLPIVGERQHLFMVQLPSGLRGWVSKAYVIRTISPNSVPEQAQGVTLSSVLGVAALVGIAMLGGIGGALAGDPEEEKMRRAVDRAMRDRGL